jgi:hypothetical protein
MKDLLSILLNAVPMFLVIGIFAIYLRRAGGGGGLTKFQKEYIEEMRKQTAIQERIASALEKSSHG